MLKNLLKSPKSPYILTGVAYLGVCVLRIAQPVNYRVLWALPSLVLAIGAVLLDCWQTGESAPKTLLKMALFVGVMQLLNYLLW